MRVKNCRHARRTLVVKARRINEEAFMPPSSYVLCNLQSASYAMHPWAAVLPSPGLLCATYERMSLENASNEAWHKLEWEARRKGCVALSCCVSSRAFYHYQEKSKASAKMHCRVEWKKKTSSGSVFRLTCTPFSLSIFIINERVLLNVR
jgi:hypothetical protein